MSSNETADEVFGRIVLAGFSVKYGGDVDSATGLFALVEIPSDLMLREDMRYAVFSENKDDIDIFDGLATGWYMVTLRRDEPAFYYPCESKEEANEEFNTIKGKFNSFEVMGWGY